MNARFWTWNNAGWVKLTITPGQTVNVRSFCYTDEGYCLSERSYTHDGDGIVCETYNRSTDCDGKHEGGDTSFCPLSALQANDGPDGMRFPAWEHGAAFQRDHAAEAAGY